MTEQSGFRVKEPYDDVLEEIFIGKKTKVDRIEKGYFIQIQKLYNLDFLEFGVNDDKLKVRAKMSGIRRKKLAKGSRFDIDLVFY